MQVPLAASLADLLHRETPLRGKDGSQWLLQGQDISSPGSCLFSGQTNMALWHAQARLLLRG
eukprot:12884256-Prorocentrum_lima.AAC.1